MTVILLYDSSHEALWHLVGMPKVSSWAVCWALTTGEGGFVLLLLGSLITWWYLGKQGYDCNRNPQKAVNGWTLCPATLVGPPHGHWMALCRQQRCRLCLVNRGPTHDPHQNIPHTLSVSMLTGDGTAWLSGLLPDFSRAFSNS